MSGCCRRHPAFQRALRIPDWPRVRVAAGLSRCRWIGSQPANLSDKCAWAKAATAPAPRPTSQSSPIPPSSYWRAMRRGGFSPARAENLSVARARLGAIAARKWRCGHPLAGPLAALATPMGHERLRVAIACTSRRAATSSSAWMSPRALGPALAPKRTSCSFLTALCE